MRLTSWNLLHCLPTPLTENSNPAQSLAQAIETLKSDVMGLQEVDFHLERSGTVNQVGLIAEMMGTSYWAFAPSVIGSPDENWRGVGGSDRTVVTAEITDALAGYGIGLVSKIPVLSWHRLELSASPVGVLMSLPKDGSLKRIYVRDHPRSALAAVLDNGWLVVNTHLSFVPVFNLLQLLKIKRWVKSLPVVEKEKVIIMGDLNLPFATLVRGFNWNSIARAWTYPTWNPKYQIDYILSQKISAEDVLQIPPVQTGVSDHLPLSAEVY